MEKGTNIQTAKGCYLCISRLPQYATTIGKFKIINGEVLFLISDDGIKHQTENLEYNTEPSAIADVLCIAKQNNYKVKLIYGCRRTGKWLSGLAFNDDNIIIHIPLSNEQITQLKIRLTDEKMAAAMKLVKKFARSSIAPINSAIVTVSAPQ